MGAVGSESTNCRRSSRTTTQNHIRSAATHPSCGRSTNGTPRSYPRSSTWTRGSCSSRPGLRAPSPTNGTPCPPDPLPFLEGLSSFARERDLGSHLQEAPDVLRLRLHTISNCSRKFSERFHANRETVSPTFVRPDARRAAVDEDDGGEPSRLPVDALVVRR